MRVISKVLVIALLLGMYTATERGAVAEPSHTECALETADTHPELLEDSCTLVLLRTDLTVEQRAESFYLRGFGRLYARRYEAAGQDFDEGLALAPAHNRLHRQRGWVALYQVDLDKAFYHARKALELYPKGSEEHFLLGRVHLRNYQSQQALGYFSKAIALKDDHLWARYERAVILLEGNNHREAFKDTERLMKVKPDELDGLGSAFVFTRYVSFYVAVHVRHAFVLSGLGRYEDGERVLTDLVTSRRSAMTLLARARYLSQIPVGMKFSDRSPEAINDLKVAVALDPGFSTVWRTLAVDLHHARRLDEAPEANERAYKTNRVPAYVPHVLWERARILRSLDRTQDAVHFGVIAIGVSIRQGPRFATGFIEKLRERGYWRSAELPSQLSQDVIDATTACFHDPACW